MEIDRTYFRPTEVDVLVGDPSRAERELGWKATTRFGKLVEIMTKADIEAVRAGREAI